MKKISFMALVLSTGLAALAQNAQRPASFGVKAGVNLAQFRANDFPAGYEPDVNMKTSMHGGVFMNAPLGTGGFAIQPELLYSRQGSKMNVPVTVGTETVRSSYEQDLSYITLPVMLQWQSTGGLYVETGPQAGYLVHAEQDGPDDAEVKNKDSFDNFDVAWGAGLGFNTRSGLGVGARYNYGLTNSVEDGGGNNSANNGPELKNSVVQVGLSWRFGAKR